MAAILAGGLTGTAAVSVALLAAALRHRRRQTPVVTVEFSHISTLAADPLWERVNREGDEVIAKEPELKHRITNTVKKQDSLEGALAHILSNKLSSVNNSPRLLYRVFKSVLEDPKSTESGVSLSQHIRDDLNAVQERDQACTGPLQALLFFKGYQSIQAHRIAHALWHQGRRWMALQVQSSVSEKFGVDIHPAALIGCRVMIDHATGVVIGETARVGDDCSLLHNVTLGATGKVSGDRHPKLGSGVLVGAGAYIIGNIYIGDNAKLGCGSVVLKDIPAGATAVGAPAKVIGRSKDATPGREMDVGLKNVDMKTNSSAFDLYKLSSPKKEGYIANRCLQYVFKDILSPSDIDRLFFELDSDHSGQVPIAEVKKHLMDALCKCKTSYNKGSCGTAFTESMKFEQIEEVFEKFTKCTAAAGIAH